MRQAVAELFLDVGAIHGEGPTWDAETDRLLWVDIHGQRVHRTSQDGGDSFVDYAQPTTAVAPRRGGGLALAMLDGFWLEDPRGALQRVFRLPDSTMVQLNDGKCDSRGRFWVGSMAKDGVSPIGSLFRVDPDGQVTTMLTKVAISNGLGWTSDQRTMYYIDMGTGRVDAFDFDVTTGRLAGRRPVVVIPKGAGKPDGMTIDDDGCLWVALWGGGAVHRYTPEGRLDTILTLPVSQVTSCAFGGSQSRDLFVTTSTLGSEKPATSQMPAGALYRWSPGTSGPAANPFAG